MANTPKREVLTDAQRELVETAKANLEAKINRLNEAGWHNQFDYENYGVQYNSIYNKKTGNVRSLQDSGLTSRQYIHLTRMMASSPELTEEWNLERARQIAGKIYDKLNKEGRFSFEELLDKTYSKEEFIKDYVEKVKEYLRDDEDFNYEVIKSIYLEGNKIISTNSDPDLGM